MFVTFFSGASHNDPRAAKLNAIGTKLPAVQVETYLYTQVLRYFSLVCGLTSWLSRVSSSNSYFCLSLIPLRGKKSTPPKSLPLRHRPVIIADACGCLTCSAYSAYSAFAAALRSQRTIHIYLILPSALLPLRLFPLDWPRRFLLDNILPRIPSRRRGRRASSSHRRGRRLPTAHRRGPTARG